MQVLAFEEGEHTGDDAYKNSEGMQGCIQENVWSPIGQGHSELRLRWEDCWSPGDGGCSELRSHHCTPFWATEQDAVSKEKRSSAAELLVCVSVLNFPGARQQARGTHPRQRSHFILRTSSRIARYSIH
ncbi:hypothetical protein AAY473_020623 [Plecturocebus cupreus]